MRALYHFRTRGTGAEGVHIAGIAGALSRMGYEVEFLSPSGIQPGRTKGQSPFSSKSASSLLGRIADHAPGFVFELLELAYNLSAFTGLLRSIAANRPTLIYQRHAFFLFATAVVARLFRIPLVIEVNELAGDDRIRSQPVFGSLAKSIDAWVLNGADLVCVVSPYLARKTVSLGVHPDRVLTVPNAVGPEMLGTPGARRESTRASLGIADDEVVIGFVGWFVEWHHLDKMIDSFADACSSTDCPLVLLLVGEGPLEPSLREQSQAINSGNVIFAGAVEHDRMADTIDSFDISVVPACNAYRSPIKLLEYMSRSTTVVAPDVEPVREVTTHNENAYLFDPRSPDALSKALVELAMSPARRKKLALAALKQVKRHHTWDVNARNVLEALNRVCG